MEGERTVSAMSGKSQELRSLALTPTWSVATVLTILVAVSVLVERSIHWLSLWLKKTHRNPLFEALEKMKEELMLLGFISLFLTATSRTISNICIDSRFYNSKFSPCTRPEAVDGVETEYSKTEELMALLIEKMSHSTCKEGHEPFVSHEGLEQLHLFIFVMGITHVSYSCLTMLLAIVKIHTWRKWEDEAHIDHHGALTDVTGALTMRRQSTFLKVHTSNPWSRNRLIIWLACFFRQFGRSVVHSDYLTLRLGFIKNHNLLLKYDFHSYMIRCMEEEFKTIVGVSAPLWGFVVAFMLFNINGSNLYFWVAIIPITLVLLVGAKLQHVIATLTLESVGMNGCCPVDRLKPRDELFWFKKPELLLSLIHFVLFQNSFELASFFWFWWQFGYDSCFIRNHWLDYVRLIIGLAGQFLCSYSTLPLYALVAQMGSNYKAALIPRRVRETIHGWRQVARRRAARRSRHGADDSTVRTETSTVCSLEEDDRDPSYLDYLRIELQSASTRSTALPYEEGGSSVPRGNLGGSAVLPLLGSASLPSSPPMPEPGHVGISRCLSMPNDAAGPEDCGSGGRRG